MLLALEEQMGYAETGLSEEEIMTHIGHEVFHSFLDPQRETCCICQVRPTPCLIHLIVTNIYMEFESYH